MNKKQQTFPKHICVYCGSSSQVNNHFFQEAETLGKIFAQNNIELIYGAGGIGIMGAIADAVLQNGGEVTGVIPQFMVDAGWSKSQITHTIVTPNMHERKAKMAELSDAAVALPGGIGTFEELMEILTWKQLGLTTKPIIIVNIDGYFNPLLQMLEQAVTEKFMRDIHKTMWTVVDSADQVLEAILTAPEWDKSQQKIAAI